MNQYQLAKLVASATAFTTLLYCNYAIINSISSHVVGEGKNDNAVGNVKVAAIQVAEEGTGTTSYNYQLANDQSFGFFHDIPAEQWKLYHFIVSKYEKHRNPGNPLEFVPGRAKYTRFSTTNSAEAFYGSNYEPNFSCAFERRVGGNGNGDGPKWVCDPHRLKRLSSMRKEAMKINNHAASDHDDNDNNVEVEKEKGCLIYSIGSQGDFQFEEGMYDVLGEEDACEIHTFDFGDHASKAPKNMNIHYHQWGLKASDDKKLPSDKYLTLAEIVKELGHENRTIDIFKIDCENCEWSTVKDWFGPDVPMIQQILVETHGVPIVLDRTPLSFFNGIMDSGYVMFHKEPNIQYARGSCIEFGFLKLHDDFFADVDIMRDTHGETEEEGEVE